MSIIHRNLTLLIISASFLVVLARPAHATTVYPGALPVFVGIEEVRNGLKLTPLQEAVLDSIRNEYRSEAQQIFAATDFDSVTSRAHADASMLRFQRKYNRRVLSTLNKEQKQHLVHIEARVLDGFLVLRGPIQRRLGIDSVQKAKIASVEAKILKNLQRLNRLAMHRKITSLKRAAALHILRKTSSAQLTAILNPAQKKQLNTLESWQSQAS